MTLLDTDTATPPAADLSDGRVRIEDRTVEAVDAARTSNDHGRRDRGRCRPAALAPGSLAFLGAWGVGLAIARLTGAAAVVLLLVAGAVALLGSVVAGWWRLRRVSVDAVSVARTATVGDDLILTVRHVDPARSPVAVQVDILGTTCPLDPSGSTPVVVVAPAAGVVVDLGVTVRSAGAVGVVWWRRRSRLAIDPLHVAPRADGAPLPVDRRSTVDPGESTGGNGPRIGDLDGTRQWRAGEGQKSIHWPSTLRSGEVIAFDRSAATETRWVLPLTAEAGRLRRTMEDGLRHGHAVDLEIDDEAGRAEPIRHRDDVLVWSAIAAHRQTPAQHSSPDRVAVWKRQVTRPARRDSSVPLAPRQRLLTALAAVIALNMLSGALDASLASRGAVTLGIAVATGLSFWASAGRRTIWIRALIAVVALGALARIAVESAGIGGLLEALRGPLPDLLLLLVALHGAEIVDRRTNRVHVAITFVVVAYAAGLRIDGNVGFWLLAWGVVAIAAMTVGEPVSRTTRVRIAPIVAWCVVGLAATIGLAAFVPIPDGPASLGLPSLSPPGATIDSSGALLGPDGSTSPTPPPPPGQAPARGALGQAGGYPGFSDTLDTAVRGDLGDEVVMRVRAPEPAFWRGQIFTEFDGRTWRVTPERGRTVQGPQIDVRPTIGDLPATGTPTAEFVQTYIVEADLPNVIFGAGRPQTVIFDGSVVTRSDGALRADRTLTDGTVYSVVSQRVDVTSDVLRAQGDLGDFFGRFETDPTLASELDRFLEIPDSTSRATLALAADLRVPGSTYDTILAYQAWMGLNTLYDLNAPVP
ncbi:MAG: DUF3488 domain-containing protein, partial [Ilumatobacter sp.]